MPWSECLTGRFRDAHVDAGYTCLRALLSSNVHIDREPPRSGTLRATLSAPVDSMRLLPCSRGGQAGFREQHLLLALELIMHHLPAPLDALTDSQVSCRHGPLNCDDRVCKREGRLHCFWRSTGACRLINEGRRSMAQRAGAKVDSNA